MITTNPSEVKTKLIEKAQLQNDILMHLYTMGITAVTTASELKQGILYLGGPESSKLSVVEISKNDTKITESKIQNIQSFPSVEFQEDKMTFWQYFGCGQDREIKYSNLTLESGLNVIETFEGGSKTPKRHKKPNTRKDRCPNTLLFCPHPDCLQSFEQQDNFDRHIINRQRANVSLLTSMDSVKLHYCDMACKSSHSKAVGRCSTEEVISDMEISSSVLKKFDARGWAIPKSSNVRLLNQAKTIPL